MGLLALLVEPLLIVRRALREQIVLLHRRLLAIVREDEVCRRLMTTPGVGPVVALTYCVTVSTDQGLDQDFNSLDAQYEAASATSPGPCWLDPDPLPL